MPEPRVPYSDDRGHDPWESWQDPPHWQPPPAQDSSQWQDPQEAPRWRDPQDAPRWQDPQDGSRWQEPPLPQDSPHWQHPQDTAYWQDPQDSPHWRNQQEAQLYDGYDGYDDQRTGETEPQDNWHGTRWHNPTDDPQWSEQQWSAPEPQWSEPQYPGYQHQQDLTAGQQPSVARYFMWRSRKYLRLAGIAVAICILIGGYALGHFGKSGQPPGQVTVDQYHAGLCIAGPASLLSLGTDKPWPQFTTQISCTKPHIAEVVYAGAYWGNGTSFPATQVRDGASAACSKEFQAYVGIPLSRSVLNVDPIVPDATSWSQGSKSLECVAWHSTPSDALGAPLTKSVRGSRK